MRVFLFVAKEGRERGVRRGFAVATLCLSTVHLPVQSLFGVRICTTETISRFSFRWFEIFELMFRLTMNGIMVHIAPGTVSQILIGMVVCGIGFSVLQYSRPYRVDYNNTLAIVCKFQLLLTLFSALLVKLRVPFFSQVRCTVPCILSFQSTVFPQLTPDVWFWSLFFRM